MSSKPIIPVTRPDLPDEDAFIAKARSLWATRTLTNNGPYQQQLEAALCETLGVQYLSLVANGTLALSLGLKALEITGEVITTPYSFVATSHALMWHGITPVFVDIDPNTLNLDPAQIEAAITEHTTAIMPVHVYGHPADVEAIEAIAQRHGLRVIYDAAHAFGVQCHCGSLLQHGDLSVLSFHATKVFHTFEGGAVVCQDAETKQRIDRLRNFGFENETTVNSVGINAKLNELQAIAGLSLLPDFETHRQRRASIDARYREGLSEAVGIRVHAPSDALVSNHGYFPLFVTLDSPLNRDALYQTLKDHNIYARRYFYPLITDFPPYRDLPSAQAQALPNAHQAAASVICLPMYASLSDQEVDFIIEVIQKATATGTRSV